MRLSPQTRLYLVREPLYCWKMSQSYSISLYNGLVVWYKRHMMGTFLNGIYFDGACLDRVYFDGACFDGVYFA